MDTEKTDHPLSIWLEKEDLKPYQFAKTAKIGQMTVYRIIHGKKATMETLDAIEFHTGGAVTIRQCMEYLRNMKELNSDGS